MDSGTKLCSDRTNMTLDKPLWLHHCTADEAASATPQTRNSGEIQTFMRPTMITHPDPLVLHEGGGVTCILQLVMDFD